ncbi:LysR family transcriptional regulator [Nocardiopsis sp. Huas11]|uniref:LysR family transcriptional regulator n=1 Tax=Nocardiopsis sp. Huas11 TaxID=2183912 RepID=UPI000EABF808|nr:LysR family transcriptional regulator [Nocardiopsis sp. Huas11]RKS09947.1 LysR family transcriptional regulator [Nocardiopsis sp. Huas11]
MAPTIEAGELECFLVLAEELHFGQTGERLHLSQSRVSQLLRSLENRIGARLVDRTSRRVRLTAFGADFLESLRPAYGALAGVVEDARARARGRRRHVRIGFQGAVYESVARAISEFQRGGPDVDVDIVEIPLADPFTLLRAGRIDAAVVLLPVEEADLALRLTFSRQPLVLALSTAHPLAAREELAAEELAGVPLVRLAGRAPSYWRRVHSPLVTPGGRSIPQQGRAGTLQEALTLVASERSALLVCAATAEYNRRPDIAYVPVAGMPDSALGLVLRGDRQGEPWDRLADVLGAAVT